MTIIPKSDAPANKQAETLEAFLDFVRVKSPFYREFWDTISSAPNPGKTLETYPLTDHAAYWQANTCLNSSVVTSEQQDGIIFKTGGTTAKPKVSFYNHAELEGVSKALATSLVRCGVRQGDKVINLFYAGDMYGSFLVHILSVFYLPIHERVGAVQLPVAGHVTTESMVTHILEFEGTVVLSTVTTMVKMAELMASAGRHGRNTAESVRLLLFSGEALYSDQVGIMKRAFPNAELRSLVYPSGDRAEWVDYESGLFRVLGRDQTAIRLGPVSIDFTHLREAVYSALGPERHVSGVQAVVGRQDAKDLLTVLVAFQPACGAEETELQLRVSEELGKARPMFKGHVDLGLVNPLRVLFVKAEELTVNERSGKSINVVDKRLTTL
ncbi:putative amp-dependent synthetase ligase [Diaporthe ampelina]|uniref:Putative amp-dependent synthetase ligase n=1 Tax=Diaporthe ampelina TaxID=1214573 RepID=A0A0G2FNW0_9PEZI|nr:putative amp-dependent synthetase ligase [Diaporthe ampelina]